MKVKGFIGREAAEELLIAGKISKLESIICSDKEELKDFEIYCSNRNIDQTEQAAEDFLLKKEKMFEEAFEKGRV